MEELLKKHQNIRFSGDGASHQNVAADRTIKTEVTMARTMLMPAALRFPKDTISTDIWPMTIYYAVWVYNRIPGMQYVLSAIEIWSRSRFDTVSETHGKFYVWDCPTYFLEPKLQKPGENIPRWDIRSQIRVNI